LSFEQKFFGKTMQAPVAAKERQFDFPAIILLPGLGASTADLPAGGPTIARVHRLLSEYGKVTTLLHMPDIDQSSTTCADLDKVILKLTRTITKTFETNTTVMVGYSVGGYIAFEVCRRLESAGYAVPILIMLDSSAYYNPIEKSFPKQVAASLRRGFKQAAAEVPFLIALRSRQLEAARLWTLALRKVFGSHRATDLRKQLLIEYWLRSIHPSTLANYGGRVVLLKAKKTRPRITDPTLGWNVYAPLLEVSEVEGDHWSMLDGQGTLETLREILSDARWSI
jgi:thioesterase domain-containing protein